MRDTDLRDLLSSGISRRRARLRGTTRVGRFDSESLRTKHIAWEPSPGQCLMTRCLECLIKWEELAMASHSDKNSTDQSGYAAEATSMHACSPSSEEDLQATFHETKFNEVKRLLTTTLPSHSDSTQARNTSQVSSPYRCRAKVVHFNSEFKV